MSGAFMLESLEGRLFLSVSPTAAPDAPSGASVVHLPLATVAPSNGGVSLTEAAGKKFTANLGSFTLRSLDLIFVADISWGDGTHSQGTLVGSFATGQYTVQGTHTYANAGKYTVDVKVFTHPAGSTIHPTSPAVEFTSVIKAIKPSAGGVILSELATQPFTAKLGEFTYKTVDQSLNAVIDWGDGTQSAGKLVGSYATGEYYVQGTHTYARADTYAVDVKIFASLIGSPIHPTSPVAEFKSVIIANPLKPSAGGLVLNEVAGQKFTAKLGEFTFKTIDEAIDADINWGDGTHSQGTLVGSYATGEYYVQGTHTYANKGTYKVDVKIFAHPIGSPVNPTVPVAAFTSVIDVTDGK